MPKALNQRALQDPSLRHFLEVVRTGSVTEAAERLHMAPSAVSRHIARLESELDTLLFERRARGMVPNAAGELLAAHAKRAWQEIERVATDIGALRGVQTGVLHIAATDGYAADLLPTLIAAFQRRHAGIRFVLQVRSQLEIPQLVRDGDADIGITFAVRSERQIHVELRHPAPILAVMAHDHPLARRRHLSLAQLAGHPMGLPAPPSSLRQLFEISCSRQGLQCEPVFEGYRLDMLLSFAAAGGGITLCGEAALRTRLVVGDVVGVPLRDREMNERHLEVQTLAGRTLPMACKAFLEDLRDALNRET